MVGLPWSQHVAFLDDRALRRTIRREVAARVAELGDHPAVLTFALGNEIPPGVVRWHGQLRVERFLRSLYEEAKAASPESLFTYVNFPPTEFLDLSFLDICAFNVYLHREADLRAYLARLQHIAGQKPLLLAEAGADSIREGEGGQADITAMHIRAAFEEGACGAIAFAWTDEWWRGGHPVEDWNVRPRRSRPPAEAGGRGRGRGVRGRAVRPRAAERLAARLGRRLRLQRRRHARGQPPLARAAHVSGLRDHPRQRRLEGSDQRDRPQLRARPRHRHAERRAERRAQRRPRRGDRRDRRLHRRRHARRSRLADVPRPAVPDLRRRRLGRSERRAVRRSADRAVHRARAGRPDARAARRSHRRARARLQHGVPPRRAARDRRLQPHLPPRRRRRGRVLAAAGARLEDRLRLGGARLASPPLVGEGVLAAAGRLRRRRDLADGAPSRRNSSTGACCGAAASTARCRSCARSGARASTPASGAPRRSRRCTAPTCTRSRSCRTRSGGR